MGLIPVFSNDNDGGNDLIVKLHGGSIMEFGTGDGGGYTSIGNMNVGLHGGSQLDFVGEGGVSIKDLKVGMHGGSTMDFRGSGSHGSSSIGRITGSFHGGSQLL